MNNLDLMDSSNNDYQLVNELSKLVRSYYVKNKPVDRNYAEEVISILLRNDCIELDGKGVYATDIEGIIGSFHNNKIYYNYSKSKIYYDELKYSLVGDSKEFDYYFTLLSLVHEFTHAKQDSLMFLDNSVSRIYKFCYYICEYRYDLYCHYYDKVPVERYAEIRGCYIAYLVMDRLGFNNLYYKMELVDCLIGDYFPNNESPLESFADICDLCGFDEFRDYIPEYDINKDSLWDRLFLGVAITYDEFYYLYDVLSNLSDRDYSCDDSVKKLVLDYN